MNAQFVQTLLKSGWFALGLFAVLLGARAGLHQAIEMTDIARDLSVSLVCALLFAFGLSVWLQHLKLK